MNMVRCHLEQFSYVDMLFVVLMKLEIFSFENSIDKLASSEVIVDYESYKLIKRKRTTEMIVKIIKCVIFRTLEGKTASF